MMIFKCVGVILLFCILEQCDGQPMEIEDRLSITDEIKHFSHIANDLTKGDYVATLIESIEILQDFPIHWTVKFLLDICLKLLKMIHPIFTTIFNVPQDEEGSFLENLGSSLRGEEGTNPLLSLANLFG